MFIYKSHYRSCPMLLPMVCTPTPHIFLPWTGRLLSVRRKCTMRSLNWAGLHFFRGRLARGTVSPHWLAAHIPTNWFRYGQAISAESSNQAGLLISEALYLYTYIYSLKLPNVAAYAFYPQPHTFFQRVIDPWYGISALITCP